MDNARSVEVALITAFLRAGEGAFVSGEQLSEGIGVSRAALWKRMNTLRERGFVFETRRGTGYRLVELPDLSDIEVMSRVTGVFGQTIHFFDSIGSTNDRAMERASGGAPHGTVILADAQTAGRGRLGRAWISPPGRNIYLSVVIRPEGLEPRSAGMLPLLCAVAASEAINEQTGLDVRIKWPNDIQVSGKKLGGILCEMRSEPGRVLYAVAGIGINVNMGIKDFPPELSDMATSLLTETSTPHRRTPLIAGVLDALSAWLERFMSEGGPVVAQAWRIRSATLGKQVRVQTAAQSIVGTARDIDENGALLVEVSGGQVRTISSGDVELLR